MCEVKLLEMTKYEIFTCFSKKKKKSSAFHNNYYKISNIINTNISFRFLVIKVFFCQSNKILMFI